MVLSLISPEKNEENHEQLHFLKDEVHTGIHFSDTSQIHTGVCSKREWLVHPHCFLIQPIRSMVQNPLWPTDSYWAGQVINSLLWNTKTSQFYFMRFFSVCHFLRNREIILNYITYFLCTWYVTRSCLNMLSASLGFAQAASSALVNGMW